MLVIVLLPVAFIVKACAGGAATPTPTVTPSVTTSASASASVTPSATTESPTATPTQSATTPAITDCTNADIAVSVSADATSYGIGSPVTIAMRITNIGKNECLRDVGALANEVYVTDANGNVVWTSDACQSDAKPQVVSIKPGRVFGNTQVWSGLNSGRDCTSAAPDAAAGSYLAIARNDTVQSKPFGFTIN